MDISLSLVPGFWETLSNVADVGRDSGPDGLLADFLSYLQSLDQGAHGLLVISLLPMDHPDAVER